MRKIFVLAMILSIVLITVSLSFRMMHSADIIDHPVHIGNMSLMVGILNTEDPNRDIDTVRPYLRRGDIVVFPAESYASVSKMKAWSQGIEIGTGGTSIERLLPGIKKIPADVEYVTYDYEPDFTQEFTPDQSESIGFFSRLKDEANKNGKRLVIVPVYALGQEWDWGEVAGSTDILVVQVQNFQRGFEGPDSLKPESIGMNLREVTDNLVLQTKSKSPDTKLYLQMGLSFGSSSKDILLDIEDVNNSGIDGITIWHNPTTSDSTSNAAALEEVLRNLIRK